MANMRGAIVRVPDDVPCPRCFTPCTRTELGWECVKHGLVRLHKTKGKRR